MLAPLYPIANTPSTVTVAGSGALANATSVPTVALTAALPAGLILDFGASKFAKLADAADVGDTTLDTAPIPKALVAGDVATVPGSPASVLLSEKWAKLPGGTAERLAMHLAAEMLLDLRAPAYCGDAADELGFAVVLQLNYMLEQRITPKVMKTTANNKTGMNETYRDRWINPDAQAIVDRVTGRSAVRFTPLRAGI